MANLNDASRQTGMGSNALEFIPMDLSHCGQAMALWRQSEGVVLGLADSRRGIASYLERNPGLSQVAVRDGSVVGAVLCGHDGRRGYLCHLAVAANWQRRGVGSSLVRRCLAGLRTAGIERVHIDVTVQNQSAREFWIRMGWREREDLTRFSFDIHPESGG